MSNQIERVKIEGVIITKDHLGEWVFWYAPPEQPPTPPQLGIIVGFDEKRVHVRFEDTAHCRCIPERLKWENRALTTKPNDHG